ncbi:MAG TPA: RecX family transcriptional regulator [Acetobacteraceae bacterium]|jgi:regulatory protein|nr:RecX family transcriptional regulator [Acetobacteraceae bacterium]
MANTRSGPDPGPPPTEQSLTDRAVLHLSRYGTTKAGLACVLGRYVARWAERAAAADAEAASAAASAARAAIPRVVAKLAAAGAVDDASFAQTRARRLARAGRSRRTVAAHLQARGVEPDAIAAALPDDELAAAAATARRRQIGPFRTVPADTERFRRELATLARAGFSQDIARQALAMDLAAAEALIARLRRT